jgi:small membrane protein
MIFKTFLVLALAAFVLYFLALPRQNALRKLVVLAGVGGMVVFSLQPELSTRIANWFGIGRGADFLFYISHLLLFFIAFMYYLRFRELEARLTNLVRHIAIVEAMRDERPAPTSPELTARQPDT